MFKGKQNALKFSINGQNLHFVYQGPANYQLFCDFFSDKEKYFWSNKAF